MPWPHSPRIALNLVATLVYATACAGLDSSSVDTNTNQAGLTVSEALEGSARRAGFGPDHAFESVGSNPSQAFGIRLDLYRPTYRGWPLRDQVLALWVREGEVVAVHEDLDARVPTETEPGVTAALAEKNAASALPSEATGRGTPSVRCALEIRNREPVPPADVGRRDLDFGRREPAPSPVEPDPSLEYGCEISSDAFAYRVSVDAESGSIAGFYPLSRSWNPSTAYGVDPWGSTHSFPAEHNPPDDYRLRSDKVETRDNLGRNQTHLDTAKIVTNAGDNFTAPSLHRAVMVHHGLHETYWAFRDAFQIHPWGSLRSDGGILAVVNVDGLGEPWHIAHFNPGSVIGPHVAFTPQKVAVTYSVIGHEATHFLSHAYGLPRDNHGEAGAVEEGMANALIQLLKLRLKGSADYISANGRDALNPGSYFPDAYHAAQWRPTSPATRENDWGHVHHNGFVAERWYALASAGDSGTNSLGVPYSVTGVGPKVMASVFLEAESALSGNDGFHKLKETTEIAARLICGEFSRVYASTRQAWHAVGLSNTPLVHEPYARPRWGQPRPHPWKTRLVWQTHALDAQESRWIFQIAPTADFRASDTLELEANETQFESGTPVGVYELDLEPDTEYFWRVRRADTRPEHACWRPTQRFRTKDAAPVPISPLGQGHHPWSLPFRAQLAPGTARVTIFVSTTPDKSGLLFSREFSAEQVANLETGVEITVPKNRERLYWAAAAINAGGTTWAESDFVAFGTTDPKVQLQSPIHGSMIYPWYVPYRWQGLHGAVEYMGEISVPGTSYGYSFRVEDEPFRHGRYFGTWGPTQIGHEWRVRARGPRWGTVNAPEPPETAELSQFSDTWDYTLDFEPTQATLSQPRWHPVGKVCYERDDYVSVMWNTIPEADTVKVRLHPIGGFTPSTVTTNYHAESYVREYPGERTGTTIDLVDTPRLDPRHTGYKVRVQGYGPNGEPGHYGDETDFGEFYFQPPSPSTLDPAGIDVPWTDSYVHMAWETPWAPGGKFRIELFDNRNCAGAPDDVKNVHFGRSEGVYAYESGPVSGPRSWRVRPTDDALCFVADRWSDCRTAINTLPPPKPNIIGAYQQRSIVGGWLPVATGQIYALFEGLDGVLTYRIHARQQGMTGDGVLVRTVGSSWLVNRKGQILDEYCANNPSDDENCPADPFNFLVGILIGEVQTTFSSPEIAVKACSAYGCGELSNWVPAL